MNLPNLIIIGAQKSGTSSLHHYLSFHPQIIMSAHKELNYFCKDLQWERGQKWYMSQFKGSAKIYGESSPSYTNFPERIGVAELMYSTIPEAKLIYVVRDPIERMVSQYLDRVKGGQENRSLKEALCAEQDNYYISFSKYYAQLEEFLKFYDKDKILLLKTDDLRNSRAKILRDVFRFLKVDEAFSCFEFNELVNVSSSKLKMENSRRWLRYYVSNKFWAKVMRAVSPFLEKKITSGLKKGETIQRPKVDRELRQKLFDALKADIEKLTSFSGYSFSEWI